MKTTIDNFANDMHGAGGILAALREAAAKPGSIATFVLQHYDGTDGKEYETVRVGFERCKLHGDSWRFAGPDGTIDGAGSHALIASWNVDQSVMAAAAELAFRLGRSAAKHGDYCKVFRAVKVAAEQQQAA